MTDPRSPCIVGVARRTVHPEEGDAPEPLESWVEMARAAAQDSGGHGLVEAIDDLGVSHSLSWRYDDPTARLAERLGLGEGARHYAGMSGTGPQKMIQTAARRIVAGETGVALVVGAEALATKKRLKKAGQRPAWSFPPEKKKGPPFEDPFHPSEIAHQIFQAYLTFAMFDVARRAAHGLSPEQNTRRMGELFAPMSRIAAANPHAWIRRAYSPEELVDVTPSNRMVAYPYTKNLVSIMDIDMAAGLLLTSHERADALGVPRDRRVYLRGWCAAKDPVYVAEREALGRSVAMGEASRVALETAGIGLDDVAHLDLYSCFASSVEFARDALGLAPDDPRPLTVTGGLPFHGGPGSNYMAHSVAEMVERLRADPTAAGMVSGVGMHMTYHVYAVYSATPGELRLPDETKAQSAVDSQPRREIASEGRGEGVVRAYSVVHGREAAQSAIAVCELEDGRRCYAKSEDPALMGAMEREEWVGRGVKLAPRDDGANGFRD